MRKLFIKSIACNVPIVVKITHPALKCLILKESSKYLKMKEGAFIEQYLHLDEEERLCASIQTLSIFRKR
jgi:hypothetical protein